MLGATERYNRVVDLDYLPSTYSNLCVNVHLILKTDFKQFDACAARGRDSVRRACCLDIGFRHLPSALCRRYPVHNVVVGKPPQTE